MPPAMPKPLALPRPTLQDPLEFDKKLWNSIRPKMGYVGGVSPVAAGLGQFASGAFNAAINSYTPSFSPRPSNSIVPGTNVPLSSLPAGMSFG